MSDEPIRTFPSDDYHPHFPDVQHDLYARKMKLASLLLRAQELGMPRFLLFNREHRQRLENE